MSTPCSTKTYRLSSCHSWLSPVLSDFSCTELPREYTKKRGIMTEVLPDNRLKHILGQSPQLVSGVDSVFTKFSEWIGNSGYELPLFPEYTDHGIRHIHSVLTTATSLITEGAWPLLTPEDSAVLALSILLHDCAMHLSKDGFLMLIGDSWNQTVIQGFGDCPWSQSWERFFAEARRWDGQRLHRLLGDIIKEDAGAQHREDLFQYVQRPHEMGDPDKWPPKYCKFLGEFVRRNHGRLAHEIALCGIPGTPRTGSLTDHLGSGLADIAGLVARSHAMPIRETFDYLQSRYKGRVLCRDTHPIYLMVLLRLADFMEIQSSRAPSSALQVRRLRSPLSVGEWNTHASVQEVKPDEFDREAIYVVADPQDARTFLRLKTLLSTFQMELDVSWAVLGEVYSKQDDLGLDRLGLTLRRVRSNLDDSQSFTDGVQYIPVNARFRAADADLLKLLVKPLYNNREVFGVRELVQNAVDAVREMRQYLREGMQANHRHTWPVISRRQTNADVCVEVVCSPQSRSEGDLAAPMWQYYLQVVDRGIGMTPETICDYFLTSGASIRNSEAWLIRFSNENKRSKVLRSGRFGIGVLAAFLLGDRIHVHTRHVESSMGIVFDASLEDSHIELRKLAKPHPGTTIWIKLERDVYQRLTSGEGRNAWDWYCSSDPVVLRSISEMDAPLKSSYHLPAAGARPSANWRIAKHSRFSEVHWTYGDKAPGVCCNGILVIKEWDEKQCFSIVNDPFITLRVPKLNYYDPDGNLPLNILRTQLDEKTIEGDSEILDDVLRDLAAFMLGCAPVVPFATSSHMQHYSEDHPAVVEAPLRHISTTGCPWVCLQDGTVYAHPWLLHRASVDSLIIACCHTNRSTNGKNLFPYNLSHKGLGGLIIREDRLRFFMDVLHGRFDREEPWAENHIAGAIIAIQEKHIPQLSAEHTLFIRSNEPTLKSSGWWIYTRKLIPESVMFDLSAQLQRDFSPGKGQSIPFYCRLFLRPGASMKTSVITEYLSAIGSR